MLRLYLLRHAKSSWSDPSLADFDRPLNKRGRSDLPNIGRAMREKDYRPDRIICSSACRTAQTLGGLLPSMRGDYSLSLIDELYEGYAPDYLLVIRDYAQQAKSLMVIGHNTGMQDIALKLIGKGDGPTLMAMEEKFPTGALAVIDFDVESWNDVTAQTGTLVDFIKPRDLTQEPSEELIENPAPTFFRR